MNSLIRSAAISCLGLGIVFGGSSAFGMTPTRQDFSGNFMLVDSPNFGVSFPESTEYSGFITYGESGDLLDWEIIVTELDLSINADSPSFGLSPDVTFDLSSTANWDLMIDFGIAVDAPRYTLRRDAAEIDFSAESMIGTLQYSDSAATIEVSSTGGEASVPEPATVFGLLAFLAAGSMIRKRRLSGSTLAQS